MKNVGLVLEGGGMRGVYTCGALEFFMDKDLYFRLCHNVWLKNQMKDKFIT